MIIIEKLWLRNFLSIGNVTEELDFTDPGLTLILGENLDVGGNSSRNGVGKTSIIQALSFALYGNAISNIKRDNLVNSINHKNMEVAVQFRIGKKKFKIERGRKPNILRLYIDDGLVEDPDSNESQGDSRKTQEDIDAILGISYDMFKHIVAMNTYTEPFLKMRQADQRIIIEELLGITQLSTRAEALKDLVKDTKDSIKEEEYRLQSIVESNKIIHESIENLVSKSEDWETNRQRRISNIEESITGLSELDIEKEIENHELLEKYLILEAEVKRNNAAIVRYDRELKSKATSYENLTKQMQQVVDHTCHACGQELHDANAEEQKTSLQKQIDEALIELTGLLEERDKVELDLNKYKEGLEIIGNKPVTVYPNIREAYQHQNTILNFKEDLERERSLSNPFLDQIESFQTNGIREVSYDTLNDLRDNLKHQEFLMKLLSNKDSFIRKRIIDQNINHLNHRLNYYLNKVGLPHEVTFNSDLTVNIVLLGRDFDFEQLSRGEMSRVIISTSWAFRDIWESLNQSINVMFVDELIDNGIDTQGAESALDLLKTMVRERKRSIYLTSHKEELQGRVNRILKVVKEKSFTTFKHGEEEI